MRENYNKIIAIDPGKSGGIAYSTGGIQETNVVNMPQSFRDKAQLFRDISPDLSRTICFIEKVQLQHNDLSIPGKAFRIQKMLAEYEQLKAALISSQIGFIEVSPSTWQRGLNLHVKGEEYADRKRRYKEVAANKFPHIKPTLKTCDALMILYFGLFKLEFDKQYIVDNLPPEDIDLVL